MNDDDGSSLVERLDVLNAAQESSDPVIDIGMISKKFYENPSASKYIIREIKPPFADDRLVQVTNDEFSSDEIKKILASCDGCGSLITSTCTSGCAITCTGACAGNCGSTCYSCEGTCEAFCQETCANVCSTGCTGSCTGSCSGKSCGNNCTGCSGTCSGGWLLRESLPN